MQRALQFKMKADGNLTYDIPRGYGQLHHGNALAVQ